MQQADYSELDPGSVAAWLGHGLPASVVKRLMAVPRFAGRVSGLIEARMGELPPQLEPTQAALLEMDRWALTGLALRAGAVWYGRLIAKMIDGASVRALVSEIGPQLRTTGLQRRDLAPDIQAEDLELLSQGLERQGMGCIKAWAMQQAPGIAMRLELRLPRRPMASDEHAQFGPAIIDALLWEIVG